MICSSLNRLPLIVRPSIHGRTLLKSGGDSGAQVKLFTCQQAAEFLQEAGLVDLGRKWVEDQIDRGKIPCTVIARRRRVRQDHLQRMLNGWIAEAS